MPSDKATQYPTPNSGTTPGPRGKQDEVAAGTSILLVEDQQPVREMVQLILERNGYQVFAAESGPAALDVWRTRNGDFDLLLTDLVMPKGMSGLDLAGRLRRTNPDLKVIFTSGYSAAIAGRDHALEDDAAFLPKPFAPRELLHIVRNCLDS